MRSAAITAALIAAAGLLTAAEQNLNPVYGMRENHINFSHLGHEHTGCEYCHLQKEEKQAHFYSMPGHQQCLKCHEQADASKGTTAACEQCHKKGTGSPRREDRNRASLKFRHQLHIETPDSCRSCHLPEHESEPTGMLPNAGMCLACHAKLIKSRRCHACHPAHPDGRLTTRVMGGKLFPKGKHGGEDHDLDWKEGHGRVAKSRMQSCRVCHTVRSCDECHRGVLRDLDYHPPDWDLSHPGPARAGLLDCDSCHREQSKCLDCHRQTGVAESSAARPRNMRLHPDGYEDFHSTDARRNLKACTACHSEKDCIQCHGTAGIGMGVSPHPATFRRRCRLMRERNRRPCLKCHTESDLAARCP